MNRPLIVICDKDNDFRQELIRHFATAVDNFQLFGAKDQEELESFFQVLRHNRANLVLVFSVEFFNQIKNQETLIKNIKKGFIDYQTIIYAPENLGVNNSILSSQLSPIVIPQNDFTFYRIQNIVRNHINKVSHSRIKIRFWVSIVLFLLSVGYFWMVRMGIA